MAAEKFSNGAFVFTRISKACIPMLPADLEALARQHGLPLSLIPPYAGDRAIVSRAISATATAVSKQGWLLRPLKQSKHEVSYGVVREVKGEASTKLDYAHTYTLAWSDEGGNGVHITSKGSVPCEVITHADDIYQSLRNRIAAPDWTAAVTDYLINACCAQSMRESGVVYFVPSMALPTLVPLTAFLATVGISLMTCEIEAEALPVVAQAAQEGLADQLDALQTQVAAFDGEQKPSNYKARLEEIVKLRGRALAYQAALGIGVDQATAILAQLETQVQGLLTVRQSTVVHRSSAKSARGTPGSAPVETLAPRGGAPTTLHSLPPLAHIPTLSPSIVTAQGGFSW